MISVRVPLHAAAISSVLGSGKIIFSEWPLAVDTAEAQALTAQAAALGAPTAVGLQARFNPPVAYLRDLIADGYVGEVLSSTLVGSGGYWGPETAAVDEYLLEENNGATMRSIAFGHALDALSLVFGEPSDLNVQQATRRTQIRNTDTDPLVPMTAADQVWFSGRTPAGAVLTGHYRGGRWRGTNLLWEILGTEGEIRVTAPSGHLQVQPLNLQGARGTASTSRTFRSPPSMCACKASTRSAEPGVHRRPHLRAAAPRPQGGHHRRPDLGTRRPPPHQHPTQPMTSHHVSRKPSDLRVDVPCLCVRSSSPASPDLVRRSNPFAADFRRRVQPGPRAPAIASAHPPRDTAAPATAQFGQWAMTA